MTAAIAVRRSNGVGVPLCESCARAPATVGVAWPDAEVFTVCAGCTPRPAAAAAAVRGAS